MAAAESGRHPDVRKLQEQRISDGQAGTRTIIRDANEQHARLAMTGHIVSERADCFMNPIAAHATQ